jgi:hypothetical protein
MNVNGRREVYFPAAPQQAAPESEEASSLLYNCRALAIAVRSVAIATAFLAWNILRMFIALVVVVVQLTPYLAIFVTIFGASYVRAQCFYRHGWTLLESIPPWWWRYWQCVAQPHEVCFDNHVRPLWERIWQ